MQRPASVQCSRTTVSGVGALRYPTGGQLSDGTPLGLPWPAAAAPGLPPPLRCESRRSVAVAVASARGGSAQPSESRGPPFPAAPHGRAGTPRRRRHRQGSAAQPPLTESASAAQPTDGAVGPAHATPRHARTPRHGQRLRS